MLLLAALLCTLEDRVNFGYHAIENPLEIHDLHATMMHLLGVQHESLTINHGGREMRLTDVHGRVVRDLCIS